jgi:exosortase
MALTSVAMVIATMTGVERLWERWGGYPYNHAFAIFGMSAWLAIAASRNATIERLHPSAFGAIGLFLVLAIYLVFEAFDLTLGMQAMLPLILLAITATILGLSAASRFATPILFLYFAIPIWDLMIPPLQSITTAVVYTALSSTGFTAIIDNTLIHIPAGTFEVGEDCAGIRYFVVSFALASFYGLLYLRTWTSSLALIAIALALAILCNWIRVYSLIVIGDLTDMQHYFIAVSHARYGWGIYALSLVPVFAFAVFLERRMKESQPRPTTSEARLSSPSRFLVAAGLVSALLLASSFLQI